MRTVYEIACDIKKIMNNADRAQEYDGDTLVEIDELVNEMIMVTSYIGYKPPQAEFEKERGCENCKHKRKGMEEYPCNKCKRNADDMWEQETNADCIREMSDKELAEWIISHDDATESGGRWEKEKIMQWLSSEAKGEQDGR